MFSSSSLKSRRTKNRATQTTQQLIAFSIHQEWFGLPIWVARKVVPLGKVYGNTSDTGTGLTLDGDVEVPVLDLERRLFKTATRERWLQQQQERQKRQETTPVPAAETEEPAQNYLLIAQSSEGELIGLPLTSQPCLRRFPQAAFKPIPSTYMAQGHLECAIALVVPSAEEPPIFLIDLDRLVRPQWSLPTSEPLQERSYLEEP